MLILQTRVRPACDEERGDVEKATRGRVVERGKQITRRGVDSRTILNQVESNG